MLFCCFFVHSWSLLTKMAKRCQNAAQRRQKGQKKPSKAVCVSLGVRIFCCPPTHRTGNGPPGLTQADQGQLGSQNGKITPGGTVFRIIFEPNGNLKAQKNRDLVLAWFCTVFSQQKTAQLFLCATQFHKFITISHKFLQKTTSSSSVQFYAPKLSECPYDVWHSPQP